MMRALAVAAAMLAAAPVGAQQAGEARGGVVRVLDRLTGEVQDFDLGRGQSQSVGRLTVLLDECRYPADNPASDAFAHLTVTDGAAAEPLFSGWMVASSPALSALDHPRYDVWVLRCDVPGARGSAPARQDTGEDETPPATDDGAGQ